MKRYAVLGDGEYRVGLLLLRLLDGRAEYLLNAWMSPSHCFGLQGVNPRRGNLLPARRSMGVFSWGLQAKGGQESDSNPAGPASPSH